MKGIGPMNIFFWLATLAAFISFPIGLLQPDFNPLAASLGDMLVAIATYPVRAVLMGFFFFVLCVFLVLAERSVLKLIFPANVSNALVVPLAAGSSWLIGSAIGSAIYSYSFV